jgi:peptidoglycan/xylan/chitin deacetylase (PgdA/CDA1 family)
MKLPILLYHKIAEIPSGARYPTNYVTPKQFAAQLALLRRLGYETITFAEYLAYRDRKARLPRRPVIITFDDGYRSNRDIALPILQRHGFTATVFLVAGRVGQTNAWDADELQEPLLGEDDIRAMQAVGTDFQSHTMNHSRLTRLSPSETLAELRASRERLTELVGRPVSVLSYPYGAYDEDIRRLARAADYRAAVTVRRRINADGTDPFALARIPVTYLSLLPGFAWDLWRLRWFHRT